MLSLDNSATDSLGLVSISCVCEVVFRRLSRYKPNPMSVWRWEEVVIDLFQVLHACNYRILGNKYLTFWTNSINFLWSSFQPYIACYHHDLKFTENFHTIALNYILNLQNLSTSKILGYMIDMSKHALNWCLSYMGEIFAWCKFLQFSQIDRLPRKYEPQKFRCSALRIS